ncbi:MAG: glycosyltransferase family 39 protein, partial [Actinomycetota bacterium]
METTPQTRRRPAIVEVVAPRPHVPAAQARREPRPLLAAGIALALVAGLVLRVLVDSPLWLDEALSVNIARLPVPDLLDALRRDGSPPLYYLLLHVWIGWFGAGDAAVRSLSVAFSVATLPLAWLAGRRLGDRRGAWAAVLLVATSPFAVRYASETRMYALLMLLALGAWLALSASLVRPTVTRLAALGLVTGLLCLTHYWALYLVAAMFLAACWFTRTDATRPAALRAVGAMAAGGLLFVPWLPSFVFQARHTGTPWGEPGGLRILPYALEGWSGGRGPAALGLAAILCLLAAAAVLRHRRGDRDPALVLAWLVAGTLGIAAAAELAVGVSFALRY